MGRKSEYYHSEVQVEDISFQPVFGYNLKLLRPIVKEFNNSKNTKEKIELSKQLPDELFCNCRFCGKKIVYPHSLLECHKDGSISVVQPTTWKRIIDNKEYVLSCCEDCLLNHFKNDPPKAPKYYTMKGNRFGAYIYGYSEEEYKKITSMTVGVTKKSMIRKWGEEEGLKRWKKYCDKHSYIASKEFYKDKYGELEGEKKYYEDRAMTLKMCIKRHGKIKGKKIWGSYCEQQRYTCTKEHFINKWGEEEGTKKYENARIAFANAGLQDKFSTVSNISQELFISLYDKIKNTDEIYFDKLNNEYVCMCSEHCYFLDFYDKTKNIVIEFNGDYWHGNPLKYNNDDKIIGYGGKCTLVKQQHKNDEIRKNEICEKLNNPTYIVVWENDYRKDKEGTINKLLKYFK